MHKKPTVLIIMDGYGLGPPGEGNAIHLAKTPNLDLLFQRWPHTTLSASGLDVGLPPGQIGNSEVGHTNIGAGRVVFQELPRISNAIEDGSFFKNRAYHAAMKNCREKGSALHLLGLVSDGGVHSHINHLFALVEMAKRQGLDRVYIHAFLDGRDVGPATGAGYIESLEQKLKELGLGRIATVMGRFYAMDRDRRWDRVKIAYDAMVLGAAPLSPDPVAAVKASYARGITDEFMEPVICDPQGSIGPEDSVIFFNFRPDRARELTYAFTDPDFEGFQRAGGFFPLFYVCTCRYDEKLIGLPVAFPPEEILGTFGEYISGLGLKQLRVAETEKYAHVTFFFNGGKELCCPGEDRVLIPSPRDFPTYDLIPQMSAYQVAREATERIRSGVYDAVILNFANCDMVGHTGVLSAAVQAVETVDACVGQVTDAALRMGGFALITADHGNADRMLDEARKPYTAHTTNPVPFISAGAQVKLRPGRLANIAPTMLELMGLEKPGEMTEGSLIIH